MLERFEFLALLIWIFALKEEEESFQASIIHYFHIDHNALCLPTKILHNYCFQFLLGITVIPREIQDNGYAKFWCVNKVHYGLCEMVNTEFFL